MNENNDGTFLKVRKSDLDAVETESMVDIYENCVIRFSNINRPKMTLEEMHAEIAQFFAELAKQYYESSRAHTYFKKKRERITNEVPS